MKIWPVLLVMAAINPALVLANEEDQDVVEAVRIAIQCEIMEMLNQPQNERMQQMIISMTNEKDPHKRIKIMHENMAGMHLYMIHKHMAATRNESSDTSRQNTDGAVQETTSPEQAVGTGWCSS